MPSFLQLLSDLISFVKIASYPTIFNRIFVQSISIDCVCGVWPSLYDGAVPQYLLTNAKVRKFAATFYFFNIEVLYNSNLVELHLSYCECKH